MRKNDAKTLKQNELFSTLIFHRFFVDFGLVLEGLGEALGLILAYKKGPKLAKLFVSINIAIFKGFGRGLGRVLGRFGERSGRVLGRPGSLLGAPGTSQRCFKCFVVFLKLF